MNLGVESEKVEFKKTTAELKDAMKDISAMLNKHGEGTLYFGVKPTGEVVGQQITANTLNDVATHIKTAIREMIYPTITTENIEGKEIIKVEFKGTEIPYSAYGRYYKRVFDRAEEMTPRELRHAITNTDFSSLWENNKSQVKTNDISTLSVSNFYHKAITSGRLLPMKEYNAEELLTTLGLVKEDQLTNAGYYLFSNREPAVLKMVIYATDEKINILHIEREYGNIYDLIDKAINFISKNITWRIEIDGKTAKRTEIPEVPQGAIREVVVNAFAHANYRTFTEHEIVITPNFIEIYNPGEFPDNKTPEDFVDKRLPSMPRNKNILNVLYRSKNVGMVGSGLRRVFELCKEENVEIKYENSEYGSRAIFSRKQPNARKEKEKGEEREEILSDEERIYNIIKREPGITRQEISEETKFSVRKIQRIINKLTDEGKLKRIGNNVSGKWVTR